MDNKISIAVVDVPEHPAYRKMDVEELKEKGYQYHGWGRLTLECLAGAVAALICKWYRMNRNLSMQMQLVIPPELLFTAMSIFRKDGLTDSFVTRLIDRVWVDDTIEALWPNCPWFLLASPEFITGDWCDAEGIYYSTGTAP